VRYQRLNTERKMNKSFNAFFSLFALAAVSMPLPTHAEENTIMSGEVVEIVHFDLSAGVSDETFAKSAEAATVFMKKQSGFISRRLSKSDNGGYVDHVTWATMKDAQNAMEASMKDASLAPFMQAIDPNSIKIEHQTVISKVN
jgi:hypothetical protein